MIGRKINFKDKNSIMKHFFILCWKPILNVLSSVIAGFTASAYVASITPDVDLAWGESYTHWEFYALIIVALAIFISTSFQMKSEFNALDDAHCKKYVRENILPAQVEKIKEDIQKGKPIGNGLNNINLLLDKIK